MSGAGAQGRLPAGEVALVGGRRPCRCTATHPQRRVVVTGGPGSGKTALLEIAQRHFCEHVVVLPESASLLFRGGFPRLSTDQARRAAQRAIFHVQRELEAVAAADPRTSIVLCDRGTLDGIAYWPGDPRDFFEGVGTTLEAQLARYEAVIHLRVPETHDGYNHTNPLRIESQKQAREIDERILAVWEKHPRRTVVPASHDFLTKTRTAVEAIEREVPDCCRAAPAEAAIAE